MMSMHVCRVCLQSSQRAGLTRRNLSVFYKICAVYTGDIQKETSAWVCVYCWRRASQCVRFIQLARRTEMLLKTNSAIDKNSEEFYPYTIVRLQNTIACEDNECEASDISFHTEQQILCDEPAIYVKYQKDIKFIDECVEEINYGAEIEAMVNVTEKSVIEIEIKPLVESKEQLREIFPKQNIRKDRHRTDITYNRPLYKEKVNITVEDIAKSLGFTLLLYSEDQVKEEVEKKKENLDYMQSDYKCDKCATGYEYEHDYNTHVATKHSESAGAHSCSVCYYRFTTPAELAKHMEEHLIRGRCVRCEAIVERANWREHSADAQKHENLHECEVCNKKYVTRQGLSRHKMVIHSPNDSVWTCDICKKIFKHKNSLRYHMLYHLEKTYECIHCSKKYATKGVYNNHIRTRHVGQRQMRKRRAASSRPQPCAPLDERYCVECDMHFKTKENLVQHCTISRKHGEHTFRFECGVCSKRFGKRFLLEHHVKARHGEAKDYPCEQCDKSFATQLVLKRHIRRTHMKREQTRDFVCEVCGAAFLNNNTLKKHTEAVHEKLRPYECNICDTSFGHSSTLSKHNERKHNRVKREQTKAVGPSKNQSQID